MPGFDEGPDFGAAGEAFCGDAEGDLDPRAMGLVEELEEAAESAGERGFGCPSWTGEEDAPDLRIDGVKDQTPFGFVEADDCREREERGLERGRVVHGGDSRKRDSPTRGESLVHRRSGPRLLHECCEAWGDGIGPDLVAFGVEMEQVGHDFFGEGAVRFEEFRAEVEVVYGFPVVELGDDGVHGLVLVALRVICVTCSAREDAEEEDFGVLRALVDGADDVTDSVGDFFWGVLLGAAVVGADHENDDLGFDAVELTVLDAPEDVLGSVAADPEVGWGVFSEGSLPDCALASPTCGDGVAEEHELGFSFLCDGDEGVVGFHEAFLRSAGFGIHLWGSDIRLLDGQRSGSGLLGWGCVLGEHVTCEKQRDEGEGF